MAVDVGGINVGWMGGWMTDVGWTDVGRMDACWIDG